LCRDAKEVCSILPGDTILPDEPEVYLVDERRRLECVIDAFAPKIRRGGPPELPVDERQQIVASLQIAMPPRPEQSADVTGWLPLRS